MSIAYEKAIKQGNKSISRYPIKTDELRFPDRIFGTNDFAGGASAPTAAYLD